jgi:hypothetical protein
LGIYSQKKKQNQQEISPMRGFSCHLGEKLAIYGYEFKTTGRSLTKTKRAAAHSFGNA